VGPPDNFGGGNFPGGGTSDVQCISEGDRIDIVFVVRADSEGGVGGQLGGAPFGSLPWPFFTTPEGEGVQPQAAKRAVGWEKSCWLAPPPHVPLIKSYRQRFGGGGGSRKLEEKAGGWLPAADWTGPPPPGGVPFALRKALVPAPDDHVLMEVGLERDCDPMRG